MDDVALQFLKDMLATPSPSGSEQAIQKVIHDYVRPFAKVNIDWHGNLIAAVNPGGHPRIMLAGHCDQIGLMVKHIDADGFIWVDSIGGWDIQMLIGQNMVIWSQSGPVRGVISRKAIHLLSPDDRKKVPELKDLWIDIGVKNGEEARQVVSVGDPVTFELGYRALRNGIAGAAGMDNKVGAWTVMNALRKVAEAEPLAAVFAVSTVQEEIGLRGAQTSAFSIDPHLGIAVDVTHATDCPTMDHRQYGDISLGLGPVVYRGPNINPVVHKRLAALATEKSIPIQLGGLSRPAGNDANIMQINRGGVATGIVAIPNRYMHSPVELVSLSDLGHAAELVAAFCLSLTPDCDFTPQV